MPKGPPEEAFRRFLSSTGDIREITSSFRVLCDELSTSRDENWSTDGEPIDGHHRGIERCKELCERVNCQESKTLLQCLINRASHVEYERGTACRNTKVCDLHLYTIWILNKYIGVHWPIQCATPCVFVFWGSHPHSLIIIVIIKGSWNSLCTWW